jgi:hypothetical protein
MLLVMVVGGGVCWVGTVQQVVQEASCQGRLAW